MIAIHLGGALAVTRAAWPIMREQGYGRIVNTSSASVFGLPGTSAYITAKAALFGLTRALSFDGRRSDIKVNAVMPSAYPAPPRRASSSRPVMAGWLPTRAGVAVRRCAGVGRRPGARGRRSSSAAGAPPASSSAPCPASSASPRSTTPWPVSTRRWPATRSAVPANVSDEVVDECARIGLDLAALMQGAT